MGNTPSTTQETQRKSIAFTKHTQRLLSEPRDEEPINLDDANCPLWSYFETLKDGELESTVLRNIMIYCNKPGVLHNCIQAYYKDPKLNVKKLRALAQQSNHQRVVVYANYVAGLAEQWKKNRLPVSSENTNLITK